MRQQDDERVEGMIQEKRWYQSIMKVSNLYNAVINFICVVLLTAQIGSILVMVAGRYIFSKVPPWSEQFALFCMIWFAMFSIALAVRDDSHVKMEVIDTLVSPKTLLGFKLFGNICTMIFGIVMVIFGMKISELTWATKLSAFRVPTGLQYFSAVAGGLFMITNAIVYCIEMFAKFFDENAGKEKLS